MATITSAQAGNWSATSTWVGGVVPTSIDNVIVNHSIIADVDIAVIDINCNLQSVTVLTNRNIVCSGVNGLHGNFSSKLIVNTSAGNSVNIISNVNGVSANVRDGIVINSNTNVTIAGTFTNSTFQNLGCACVQINSQSNVSLIGVFNQNSTTASVSNPNAVVRVSANSVNLTVNGVYNPSTTITEVRNSIVVADGASGINTFINIIGTSNSSFLSPIFHSNNAVNVSVEGVLYAANQLAGINAPNSLVTLKSCILLNKINQTVVLSNKINVMVNVDIRWEFNKTDNNPSSLYTAGLLTGYPLESKVEDGTVYGPSSEFEGTLLPWDSAFAQALATAQRDLQLPSILSAITAP